MKWRKIHFTRMHRAYQHSPIEWSEMHTSVCNEAEGQREKERNVAVLVWCTRKKSEKGTAVYSYAMEMEMEKIKENT